MHSTIRTMNADDFAVVLTDDERTLVRTGRVPRAERSERVSARDFAAMAGRRSYRRQRGEYRTFA